MDRLVRRASISSIIDNRSYYQFSHCDGGNKGNSTVGRFRTLPAPSQNITELNLAVFSCSNYPFGYFHASAKLTKFAEAPRFGHAANDTTLHYAQHVGDYICAPCSQRSS